MRPRPMLFAGLAALSLLACVDSTRPAPGGGASSCDPLLCAANEVPLDNSGDGCPETCAVVACASDCDCPQPDSAESDQSCPAGGWPAFGLYRSCEDWGDDGRLCVTRCGSIPTPVLNCEAAGACAGGPQCAPWEVPSLDPITHCVTDCDTRCQLDCDCYAALQAPDDTCEGLASVSVWRCIDHSCVTECAGPLKDKPDCHKAPLPTCQASQECNNIVTNSGGYCARPPGMCEDGEGVCTEVRQSQDDCAEGTPPVCGCDDKVYDSACDAVAAGVSVRGPAAMCPIPVGN